MSQVDVTTHFELFHAVLRRENDPADSERAKGVLTSIALELPTIRRFFDSEETRLMGLIWDHWALLKNAVSRHELGEIVHRQDKSEGMTAILKAYDDWVPTFKGSYDAISTMSVINRCLEDYRQYMFLAFVREAGTIATSGVVSTDPKKRGEPDKIGIKDARNFLMEKLQDSLFSSGRKNLGGWMKDIAPDLDKVYARDEDRKKNHALLIPTGITVLDKGLNGGMERRSFNLILGAAGQRKSGLARTIAYNAAASKRRVLFIPTEFAYEEELQIFAAMHAGNSAYFSGTEYGLVTVDKIHGTTLTPEVRKFLTTDIIPDMQSNLGDKLAIIQPASFTWESIRSIIEMENYKAPVDLIVLDYFGRLDTGDARDKRAAMNALAIKAKDFMLHELDNKHGGAALLSPCHASRKGIEDAKAADGNYVREAIFDYSEFEKTADLIMFIFMDQANQHDNLLKVGTCKSRRSADIPAQLVPINPGTHHIGDNDKEKEKEKERNKDEERKKNAEVRTKRSNEPALDDWIIPGDD